MDFNSKETQKSIIRLITFAVILYLGVRNIDVVWQCVGLAVSLLSPFILGGAIAFVLNVPMKAFEKRFFGKMIAKKKKAAEKLARPLSLLLAILFVIVIILIVVLVVAPELGATAVTVAKQVERNIPVWQKWLQETFEDNAMLIEWINSIDIQPQKILDTVVSMVRSGVDNILSSTISVTVGIVSSVSNFVIGLIFACYILMQKEKLIRQCKKAMYALLQKKQVEYILHVCSLSNRIFASFIAGQCIEAVILGTMFFILLTVIRFPYALLIGVLIAFTALIPVFGGFIGCAIGFLLILIVNPMQALIFLGIFLVLQQIEGNVIYPRVVGGSVGLPSIWVLVAVSVGGSLMGVVGMLIFIPLVSVLYTLFREWVYQELREKKIRVK